MIYRLYRPCSLATAFHRLPILRSTPCDKPRRSASSLSCLFLDPGRTRKVTPRQTIVSSMFIPYSSLPSPVYTAWCGYIYNPLQLLSANIYRSPQIFHLGIGCWVQAHDCQCPNRITVAVVCHPGTRHESLVILGAGVYVPAWTYPATHCAGYGSGFPVRILLPWRPVPGRTPAASGAAQT